MKIFSKLLALFVIISPVVPELSAQNGGAGLLLKNIEMVDVVNGQIVESTDILLMDGKIQEIGRGLDPATHSVVLDCTGKYAIPGLIDVHMHIANSERFTRNDLVTHLEYLLKHGITSLREVGGDARQLAELNRASSIGEIVIPEIYYSAFIATDKYYGPYRSNAWTVGCKEDYTAWMQLVEPASDLDKVMAAAKATGATGVKIYLGYDKQFLRQIVEAAERYGLMAWGHAMQYPARPNEVAECGVKVISHAYMLENEAFVGDIYDYTDGEKQKKDIDLLNVNLDKFIRNALDKDVILDATIFVNAATAANYDDPALQYIYSMTNKVYQAGVKIAAGTDWFTVPGDEYPPLFEELYLLVHHCGLSNLDAIRAATIIAAETFGGNERTGSIETGKDADIIILDKNPLDDIGNLKSITSVIKKGTVVN